MAEAGAPPAGCVRYRIEEPYIVVVNDCKEPVEVEAVEVHYHITVSRAPELEHASLHGRREIRERISVEKKLSPGGILDIYFGPVGNITEVYVVVRRDGREYRVKAERIEQG